MSEEKLHLAVDDLDLIFIRAKNAEGHWDNISARDLTDSQFDEWAKSKMEIQGNPGPWSLTERADFCDQLWQADALYMLKREASESQDQG